MPQPRDLTNSIYKSKKIKTGFSKPPFTGDPANDTTPRLLQRRLGFSTFSFSVGLMIIIALVGQFFLMSLFRWL